MRYLRVPLLALLALVALVLGGPPAVASLTAPACDYNGDGYEDLAVGIPYEDIEGNDDAGAVNVLYGSGGGLQASSPGDQFWHQDKPGVRNVCEIYDYFGDALAG